MPDITPHMSVDELRALHAQHAPKKDKGKYNNAKVLDETTGKMVHSKHELGQIQVARQLFRAGEIDFLGLQCWFAIESGRYEADIVTGKIVDIDGVPHLRLDVIDAKGAITDAYRLKRRSMKARYNIRIREV